MTQTTPVRLRRADEDDIAFIMQTERQPGFDWLVGSWDAAKHREIMAEASSAYLVATDAGGTRRGFAILRQIDDADGNVYLQRVAMAQAGGGFGRPFLGGIIGWVFDQTRAHRFWLLMKQGNARADHVYRSLGFTEEGTLRQTQIAPDGTRLDALMFSMLRPEWQSPGSQSPGSQSPGSQRPEWQSHAHSATT